MNKILSKIESFWWSIQRSTIDTKRIHDSRDSCSLTRQGRFIKRQRGIFSSSIDYTTDSCLHIIIQRSTRSETILWDDNIIREIQRWSIHMIYSENFFCYSIVYNSIFISQLVTSRDIHTIIRESYSLCRICSYIRRTSYYHKHKKYTRYHNNILHIFISKIYKKEKVILTILYQLQMILRG